MLCVSLAEPSVAAMLRALRGVRFAEIRLDAVSGLTEEGVRSIFSRRTRLIATFRPLKRNESRRLRFLASAIEAGAAYVDIEVDTPAPARRSLVGLARKNRCKVILSYHNHRETPSRGALLKTIDRAFAAGADMVKIACLSRGPRDNARLLGLLEDPRPTIVVGMGKAGAVTRISAPLLGSPISYAFSGSGRPTAPGQIEAATLISFWERIKNA